MPNLFLMRHGHAEDGAGIADFDRGLTRRGIADIRQQVNLHLRGKETIAKIVHSPYARAAQTASLACEILKIDPRVTPLLSPSGVAETVLDMIAGDPKNMLLVSHLPLIGELAGLLTGAQSVFYPGTCAKIVRADPYSHRARLDWLHHPNEHFRDG